MKVKVKICGIRTIESANAAVLGDADFIGFNFVPLSKRYIDPKKSLAIIDHIKGKTKIVGVFQNSSFKKVNATAKQLGLDYVQLHGDEDNYFMEQIELPIIKSINESQDVTNFKAKFLLLDRVRQGQGSIVEFSFAKILAENRKIFFAGGLTPDNVATVIASVKPFAVDVAGGIETNSREDVQKIGRFLANAKGVEI